MAHTLISCVTGYGKSQLQKRLLIEEAFRKQKAILYLTCQKPTCHDLLKTLLYQGFWKRTLYDDLAFNATTLGYDLNAPSEALNELDRMAESVRTISENNGVYLSRRGKQDTALNPVFDRWMPVFQSPLIYRKRWCPPHWILKLANWDSAESQFLIAGMTNSEDRAELDELRNMSRKDSDFIIGTMIRAFKPYLAHPSVIARTREGNSIPRWIREKKILVVDYSGLDLDHGAMIARGILLQYMRAARQGAGPLDIHLDDAEKGKLLDINLIDFVSLARQWDAQLFFNMQNALNLPSPEARASVWQNSDHYWGRQNDPAIADLIAEELTSIQFDPLKVLYTDYRTVQLHDGHEIRRSHSTTRTHSKAKNSAHSEHETASAGESSSSGEQVISKYREEQQETRHLENFEIQKKKKKQKMFRCGIGEFSVVNQHGCTPEPIYIPMIPEPVSWNLPFAKGMSLGDKKLTDALQEMRSRSEYQPPRYLSPPSTSSPSIPGRPPSTSAGSGMSP